MPPAVDPIARLLRWLDEARRARIPNCEAVALATVDGRGRPSVRFVLIKAIDRRGVVFYTDRRSRKGRELQNNPRVSLVFYWDAQGRQVRIEGSVEEVAADEADANWSHQNRQNQLATSVSNQSTPVRTRAELKARLRRLERALDGRQVVRPEFWKGYRVRPDVIEFWAHRDDRLHGRERYARGRGGWRRELLQP